jgi:hypothetical protein
MEPARRIAIALLVAATLVSCADHSPQKKPLRGPLFYDPAGYRLHAEINCGGELKASETSNQVTVTYYQPYIAPGGGSCPKPDVSVTLQHPLGGRHVVDGDSGATIIVITP